MAIGALIMIGARTAAAQTPTDRATGDASVASKISVYQDDDDTRVVTSLVDGDVVLPRQVTVGGHVLVDIISAASVDVVSAATPGFHEVRVEESARVGWRPSRTVDVEGAYTHSGENDWSSDAGELTAGADLADRNTRVELAGGYVRNRIGRASDPNFSERLGVVTAEASVTQLVDERTWVGLAYTLQRQDGYLSSPYRYVEVEGGLTFPELHPDARTRHAVTLRGMRLVGGAGLAASYRLYVDDWGVVSHTATAALTFEPARRWQVRVRVRGYRQSAADFWRESYATPLQFMSADRELSTFWDAGGGAKLAWQRGRWTLDGKVDVSYFSFSDFARLGARLAVVSDLGVAVAW